MDSPGAASTARSPETPWRPSRRSVLRALAASTAATAVPLLAAAPGAAAQREPELLYISAWRGTNLYGL